MTPSFAFFSLSPWSIGVKFSPFIPVFHPTVQQGQHEQRHTAPAECRASSLQLGARTRFPWCPKSAFLISFRWQEALLWEVQISKLGELGTYSLILHNRHKYGEKLNSSSRARCQDCPLHREVGTVLHCWGLSARPLASGSTTYSKDIARKPTKRTVHQRVTVRTTLCGWLVTWRKVFITRF